MSVPTGIGNLPPGVTDNDPHFDHDSQNMWDEECQHNEGGIRGGYCTDCGELVDADAAAEAAWERQQNDGEAYRGREAASALAEEQARVQRELK